MSKNNLITKVSMFKGKEVRKITYNNEWFFSVVDVIAILTDSDNPRDYWYKMKIREKQDSQIKLSTICRQLKLESSDGKSYFTVGSKDWQKGGFQRKLFTW
jgi:hypothetical protein